MEAAKVGEADGVGEEVGEGGDHAVWGVGCREVDLWCDTYMRWGMHKLVSKDEV